MIRRVGIALLAALTGLLLLVAGAEATSLGYKPADRAILLKIRKSRPSARYLYVNCPPENRIGTELGCEFRFKTATRWHKGIGRVALVPANRKSSYWRVTSLTIHGYRSGRQSCSLAGLSAHYGSTVPLRLYDFGITCFHARKFARVVDEYEYTHSFALRRHFHEQIVMAHSRGFRLNQFSCRGRRQVVQGAGENPFGIITGECRNHFGYRVFYEVEQFS